MPTFHPRLPRPLRQLLAPAAFAAACLLAADAAVADFRIGDVFYIAMENHNFTQPSSDTSAPQQILNNPAAPYLNSLITPGNPNAAQASYSSTYYNVLATAGGNNPSIHPSLPNYLWQEAGTNNGVFNDNTPYGPGGAVQTGPSLSGLLQAAGISWKSYQEDTQLAKDANGNVTYNTLPQNQWTVPTSNFSGTSPAYVNAYNGSNQYNYATKHDGQVYFTSTNGGTATAPDNSTANPEIPHYAPLQQLTADLNNNTVARYNLITPNQFNDMHTALTNGFTYNGVHYTGDAAAIAQGDNFLSTVVPQIMASQAYKNNGAIVIWFDETEGTNANDLTHTLAEIVLSPLAKGNAYNSTLYYTHSSDLRTLQTLFGVSAPGGGYLGDANSPGTNDLSDLFISNAVPEPSSVVMLGLGLSAAVVAGRFIRRKPV